jgi:hypothetical protein
VGYGALVAYVGVMLLLEARAPARDRAPPAGPLAAIACWLFVALAAANVASFLLECGFGPCPDTPLGYLWMPGAK